jgi:protein TonB
MFEDATFHSSGVLHDKTPRWMLLTLTMNAALVTVFIAAPLIYPDSLPGAALRKMLIAPPPPSRPVATVTRTTPSTNRVLVALPNPFLAPTLIPTQIDNTRDEAPPQASFPDGSLNQVEGATNAPSILAPSILAQTQPVTVVHPAEQARMRISEPTAGTLILSRVLPTYPAIAKATGTAGTVVLAATISQSGKIENLHVVSGPGMLQRAAFDAVQQWRYRPYLLNGQPVAVETTIHVVFSLSGR